jgi:hypothetical protein
MLSEINWIFHFKILFFYSEIKFELIMYDEWYFDA